MASRWHTSWSLLPGQMDCACVRIPYYTSMFQACYDACVICLTNGGTLNTIITFMVFIMIYINYLKEEAKM